MRMGDTVACDEPGTVSSVGNLPCSSPSKMASLVDLILRCCSVGSSIAGGSWAANPAEKRRACRRTGVIKKSETNWAIAKLGRRSATSFGAVVCVWRNGHGRRRRISSSPGEVEVGSERPTCAFPGSWWLDEPLSLDACEPATGGTQGREGPETSGALRRCLQLGSMTHPI